MYYKNIIADILSKSKTKASCLIIIYVSVKFRNIKEGLQSIPSLPSDVMHSVYVSARRFLRFARTTTSTIISTVTT